MHVNFPTHMKTETSYQHFRVSVTFLNAILYSVLLQFQYVLPKRGTCPILTNFLIKNL